MKKEKFYSLQVAGLQRKLPIVSVAPNLAIASFVILGDSELVIAAAQELAKKLPEADYFITAEAKGIPLINITISGLAVFLPFDLITEYSSVT